MAIDKKQEIYESLKALEVMELITKKTNAIKELDKQIKALTELRSDQATARLKMSKALEKIQDQLTTIEVIDKLLKEKDF